MTQLGGKGQDSQEVYCSVEEGTYSDDFEAAYISGTQTGARNFLKKNLFRTTELTSCALSMFSSTFETVSEGKGTEVLGFTVELGGITCRVGGGEVR